MEEQGSTAPVAPARPPAAPIGPSVEDGGIDPNLYRLVGARYVLEERLGGGALATTYRAFDRHGQRWVALKLFRRRADPDLWARFERLASALRDVEHPSVAATLDYGLDRGYPFLALELIDGGTLRQEIERTGRLEPGRVRDLLEQLAEALAAAHERGVVHQDLRPENVLLTQSGRVKLSDFGLAEVFAEPNVAAPDPRRVPYVSPEQVLGEPPDPSMDVYALGAIGYELLTGRPPFAGGNLLASLSRRLVQEPPPVDTVRSDVPVGLSNVLERALCPNVVERFPDAREFRAALRGAPWFSVRPRARAGAVPTSPDLTGLLEALAGPRYLVLLPLLFSATIVVVAYLIYTVALPRVLGGFQTTIVPDLTGRALEDARAVASVSGVELIVDGAEPTPDQPRGTVIRQSPPPGREVRRGTTIRLTLSAGVPTPELVGKNVNAARAELIRTGWDPPRIEARYAPAAPLRAVIEQRPGPGELSPRLGEVTLVVAAQNLAAGRPAWASSNTRAVGALTDGNESTAWRAAGAVGEWVEVGLGQPTSIGGLELLPVPEARGVFEVWVWDSAGDARAVHTLRLDGSSDQVVRYQFARPLDGIMKVRVVAVEGDGPVGWREIRLLDQS